VTPALALPPARPFTLSRLVAVVVACAATAVACAVVALAWGEQPITWAGVGTHGSTEETIFFALRLPRVALAAIVGMALAASGAMLQSLMRNPLADPFVLGVSGGAGLGATVAIALGFSTAGVLGLSGTSLFALAGALGATAVVLTVGRLGGGREAHSTLLAGVIFNAFALAAIIFIKALVAPDRLGEVLFWLSGRLGPEAPQALFATFAVVSACVLGMTALAPRLNLLSLGDEDAHSLGVQVQATRLWLLLLGSLAVASAVSLAGLVGFVGLLVPHLARLLFGADQRVVVPSSAFLGAAFLMLADLAARLLFRVFSTEPPVGVITALLGGPAFLWLMLRARRGARAG
jgi:iron complex transport system permease protein